MPVQRFWYYVARGNRAHTKRDIGKKNRCGFKLQINEFIEGKQL